MQETEKVSASECGTTCQACELWKLRSPDRDELSVQGGRMVWLSAFIFLLPLVGAVAGAVTGRGDAVRQVILGLIGFFTCAGVAAWTVRRLRPRLARSP